VSRGNTIMRAGLLFTVMIVLALFAIGGCGPSEQSLENAKTQARHYGNVHLDEIRRSNPSLVPSFYINGLFVVANASSDGSWVSGYTVTGNWYIWSEYWLIAAALLLIEYVILGAILCIGDDDKDAACATAAAVTGFGFVQFLILWGIAGLLGMTVASWPGWIFCLSVMFLPIEAGGFFGVKYRVDKKEDRRRMAMAAAEQRKRAAVEAEAALARAKVQAEADRIRVAAVVAAEQRKRKIAKGN
jgi:hypothetical protein